MFPVVVESSFDLPFCVFCPGPSFHRAFDHESIMDWMGSSETMEAKVHASESSMGRRIIKTHGGH